jgi:hypothetical protein
MPAQLPFWLAGHAQTRDARFDRGALKGSDNGRFDRVDDRRFCDTP